MLTLSPAFAEKCNPLDPNSCGLYDCGGNSWSPDESEGNGDNLSLRSGQVNMIGSSKICLNASGPGLVKFVWKVDPTAQHVGTLSFWVGNSQAAVCNSPDWLPVSYSLREEKDYELSWQFQKIKSYPEGVGSGWIDDLDVTDFYAYSNQDLSKSQNYKNYSTNSIAGYPLGIDAYGNIFINSASIIINTSNINVTMGNSSIISTNLQGNNITKYDSNKFDNINDVVVGNCSCPSFGKSLRRYYKIQDALDNASDNDEIFLCNNSYSERIIINKSIKITGENNSSTTIKANSGSIIYVSHDNVSLNDLSIINLGGLDVVGVEVESSDNFMMKNCLIHNCSKGIAVNNSSDITIQKNKIYTEGNGTNECKDETCSSYLIGVRLKCSLPGMMITENEIIMKGNESIGSYGIVYDGLSSYYDRDKWKNIFDVSRCHVAYFDGREREHSCKDHVPGYTYS